MGGKRTRTRWNKMRTGQVQDENGMRPGQEQNETGRKQTG